MDATARSGPAPRRLLVVNPNANPRVTARVQASADRVLGPDCVALAVQPSEGPEAIETLADRRRAEPHALDLLSRHRGYDGYVMACFDDIAVGAARRFLRAPVVDAVEASLAVARLFAPRFGIVTTVETMVPGIRALVEAMGVAGQCSVRAAGIGVSSAAAGGDETDARLDATIETARNMDGAGAIVLGSGGLTGRAAALSARHGLPVIDCIEAAVLLADAAARQDRRPSARAGHGTGRRASALARD
ncbi:aspartate/glutamate racemase family protein [Roseivivax isoporae]|uniref:Asp/Glu racemase n=1 Tax=Roseivivax isoporae LMG 25204 TaxID=1449351 RepID=X7F3A7_9RHOB|nr:aspartate/glutamate racemase family protein [Roseivivax isoporae]ETX27300.1 Asp/Glu racemase [Roseivivax isoporae LMG 25204]